MTLALTKVTMNIPSSEWRAIAAVALRRGIPKTLALRQALQTELYLQHLVDTGHKVAVISENGDLERIRFPQMESPEATQPESVAYPNASNGHAAPVLEGNGSSVTVSNRDSDQPRAKASARPTASSSSN